MAVVLLDRSVIVKGWRGKRVSVTVELELYLPEPQKREVVQMIGYIHTGLPPPSAGGASPDAARFFAAISAFFASVSSEPSSACS